MGNKEEAQMHFERGMSLYSRNRYSEAVTEFSEAIRLYPDGAGVYCNRGTAYGQLGRYSEAIADFEKALQLDPSNDDCIHNIAITKRARGW